MTAETRHARAEAQQVVGEALFAQVLEPSPPAVEGGEWFADDPVNEPGDGRPVVSPVGNGDLTWDDWLTDHPDHGSWVSERWLGGPRSLGPDPPELATTRVALHRLAVYVMSPARRRSNGKIGLRWTLGGFGTPFFHPTGTRGSGGAPGIGADEQVRLEGVELVVQRGGEASAVPVVSLADAAENVLGGAPDVAWAEPFDVPPPGNLDEPLPVEPDAASYLGDWYGFGWSVLEELRADPASVESSRVQLWPEHFDAAFECLPEADGRRAGFGASPGDAAVEQPYLYVAPWTFEHVPPSRLWNAETFRGAILPLDQLLAAGDRRVAALDFFRQRLALLVT